MPYLRDFWGHVLPERPIRHKLNGFGTAMFSRQSINRAMLKLEAAGIVSRYVRHNDGTTYCRPNEATTLKAFRIAGQLLAAHSTETPIHSASLDGVQYVDEALDKRMMIAGTIAERKAVEMYGYKPSRRRVTGSKRLQATLTKLVEQRLETVMRLAEQLVCSKRLTGKRIAELIDSPPEA